MIGIVCASCQRKLTVGEDCAGKKVKCPVCGHVSIVAAEAAAVSQDPPRTAPVSALDEARPAVDGGNAATNPSVSKPDATQGLKEDSGQDASLTDFLAPPRSDDELGRLGDFRILKILGHGGMGVVFLGEDTKLGRKVAIKAMLPHLAQSRSSQLRFLREARTAAALEHDHIVPIFHVGEDRGAPYIVMPFLKGQPLDNRLKHGMPLSLLEIVRIGRETAEGLDAAHAAGLIHRDIKPANIWLEARDEGRGARGEESGAMPSRAPRPSSLPSRVKILDFGLARAASGDEGVTQQGAVVGTPAYMAPEQARGETVDARSDLFSLGVVLYRMATGQQPFRGKDALSTLVAIERDQPAPPNAVNPDLPAPFSDLVMKLLEKDPARRMGTAAAAVQALQKLEHDLIHEKDVRVPPIALAMPVTQKTSIDEVLFAIDEPRPTMNSFARPALTLPGTASSVGGSTTAPAPALAADPVKRSALRIIIPCVAGVLGLFCLLGIGIVYIATDKGTVEIQTFDADARISVLKNGKEVEILDPKSKKTWTINTGTYTLKLKDDPDGFEIDLPRDRAFTLKRGGKQVVSIRRVEKIRKNADAIAAERKTAEPPLQQSAVLQLGGKDQFVRVADFNFDGNPPLTIEGWITPLANQNGIIVVRVGNWDAPAFMLKYNGSNYHANLAKDDNDWQIAAVPIPKEINRRDHVAVVWDGKMIHCFVNGKPGEPTLLKPVLAATRPKGLLAIGFGRARGILEEVRVSKSVRYTKPFTPEARFQPDADTLALYHMDEGSGDKLTDASGNNRHGTIVGGKWVKVEGMPIATPEPQAKPALNLLALVDPIRDKINGEWKLVDGKLLGRGTQEKADYFLTLPADPPESYRLHVRFKVIKEGSIWLGLASRQGRGELMLFGIYTDLSHIDGKEFRSRPEDFARRHVNKLATGATVRLTVTVRPTGVEVAYDDDVAFRWAGDFQKQLGRWNNHPKQPLYLGGYGLGEMLYEAIQLEHLPPILPPMQPIPLDAKLSQWWVEDYKQADAVTVTEAEGEPVLRMQGAGKGAYVTKKKPYQNNHIHLEFQFTGKPPATLLTRYSWGPQSKSAVQFHIAADGKILTDHPFAKANRGQLDRGDIVFKSAIQGGSSGLPAASLRPTGQWNQLDMVRLGDRAALFINGRFIGALTDLRGFIDGEMFPIGEKGTAFGLNCVAGEVLIRRIKVREIDTLPPGLVASSGKRSPS